MVDLGQKGWKQFHLFYFTEFPDYLADKKVKNALYREKTQYI